MDSKIKIRQATENDCAMIAELYSETVRAINSRDYDSEQIDAWAKSGLDTNMWRRKISEQYFVVAEIDNVITGFASIDESGYIDFMYVHKDFQRRGIASSLLSEIERKGKEQNNSILYSHVSKTARPFFEKSGYVYFGDEINYAGEIEYINSIMVK